MYLDLHSAIQEIPDWRERLMAAHDGLHLSTAGADWVSEQVFAAIERPCDINRDSVCDVDDLDQVLNMIGRLGQSIELDLDADVEYDLDWSGGVDLDDRDAWLSLAGTQQVGAAYLSGDVDFDGTVGRADLNVVEESWTKSGELSYGDGDIDGNNVVDAIDLNAIGKNWLLSVGRQAAAVPDAAVPEPSRCGILTLGLIFVILRRRARADQRGQTSEGSP